MSFHVRLQCLLRCELNFFTGNKIKIFAGRNSDSTTLSPFGIKIYHGAKIINEEPFSYDNKNLNSSYLARIFP